MSFVCHLYVLVCHSYVTLMYLYVIRMPLLSTRMPSVCYSYILVCHLYVTRVYTCVIRLSLVCTGMSSVCHSYVLACHPHVICMWFYHEPSEIKLDDTFTSAQFSIKGFFVPHGLSHNDKGGEILLYVRETLIVLPLKKYYLPSNIEAMFFELNLRNKKWLL